MKPSKKTSVPDRSTFEIKHYIIRDEVQKGESGSPIHISTDEQTFLVKLLSKMKEFAYSSWSSWRRLPY
jgi:hypothetical protein